MKYIKKVFALAIALFTIANCTINAFAAPAEDAIVDHDAKCSLTIYSIDWTNAYKDGVAEEDTYPSSGWKDQDAEDTFIGATPVGGSPEQILGNGEISHGYAMKGVGFTIKSIATPMTIDADVNYDDIITRETQTIYLFPKTESADFLATIGLTNGLGCYDIPQAYDYLNDDYWGYTSDIVIDALAQALEDKPTQIKNALEQYILVNQGISMELTNEYGKTYMDNLDVGLYLVVETVVPEAVTSTTNPFLISLPSTTVNNNTEGTAPDGGHAWNYDVTVYPKNLSGIPSLEKTVREAASDTGNNFGSAEITDGFAHIATGSAGDTMDYQIVSTLPTITSQATTLTTYSFFDTIAEGMSYNRDVKIEVYTDSDCFDIIETWDEDSGMFTVTYSDDGLSMNIDMTKAGLAVINGTNTASTGKYAGLSDHTLRVSYSAEINSDTSFIYGEEGNCNRVILTWRRTSGDYFDTLIDDAHVYSFGLNLTKMFSDLSPEDADALDLYDHVKFVLKNETDRYWLVATLNEAEGIYYVTGHTTKEDEATVFVPVKSGDDFGKIIIRGAEDDLYSVYEIETANGYTLLDSAYPVRINADLDDNKICHIYTEDILGLIQNDPRYQYSGLEDLQLHNIPQKQLSHYGISVTATSDDDRNITMLSDGSSANAEVAITIINTRGFDLPQTGDRGTWMFGVAGGALMLLAAGIILLAFRKKEKDHTVEL